MKEEIESELPLAIRLTRIAVGVSQRKLAAAIGYTPEVWNLFELGRRRLEPKIAARALRELRRDAPKSPIVTLLLVECDRLMGGTQ